MRLPHLKAGAHEQDDVGVAETLQDANLVPKPLPHRLRVSFTQLLDSNVGDPIMHAFVHLQQCRMTLSRLTYTHMHVRTCSKGKGRREDTVGSGEDRKRRLNTIGIEI